MTEKRAWRCRACGAEHTPRCPTCRVVITGAEVSMGRCETCGSPLTAALYRCPRCQAERGFQPFPPLRPWRGRDLGIKGLQALQLLAGTVQMMGLLLLAVSCSAGAGGATPGAGAPSLLTMQGGGLLLFVAFIPVQVLLARAVKALSRGTAVVGEERPRR